MTPDLDKQATEQDTSPRQYDVYRRHAQWHLNRLFPGSVRRLTRTATEFVHQAYLSVVGRADHLETQDEEAYFKRVITNAIVDYARQRSRTRGIRLGGAYTSIEALTTWCEENWGVSHDQVLDAIRRLAEAHSFEAMLVFLHYYEGLSLRQIEIEKHISKSTAQRGLARGICFLADSLGVERAESLADAATTPSTANNSSRKGNITIVKDGET